MRHYGPEGTLPCAVGSESGARGPGGRSRANRPRRIRLQHQHDPVGMKEVFDSSAFAEKLWVRGDTERILVAMAVSGERTLQLEAGARRNSALRDYELGRTGLLGDLLDDVLNCGEVRLAALFAVEYLRR
jgi:hypothetical protein